MSTQPPSAPIRRFCFQCLRHGAEALALGLALLAVICGVLLWRLSEGPLSLEAFRPQIERALVSAFEGRDADFASAAVAWQPDERALSLQLDDVEVRSATGATIADSPKMEAGVSLLRLFIGQVSLTRVRIEGGMVSVVRTRDQGWQAGFGRPNQVRERALSQAAKAATRASAAIANTGENDPGPIARPGQNLLDLVRRPPPMADQLTELSLTGLVFRIVDDRTGRRLITNEGELTFRRAPGGMRATLAAPFPQLGMTLEAAANADRDLLRTDMSLRLAGANPANLQGIVAIPAMFAGVNASFNVAVSTVVDDGERFRDTTFAIEMGEGRWALGGKTHQLEEARFDFALNPVTDRLELRQGRLRADVARFDVTGHADGVLAAYRSGFETPVSLDLEASDIEADIRPVFDSVSRVGALRVNGDLHARARRLDLKSLMLGVYDAEAYLTGSVAMPPREQGHPLPDLRLRGRINGDIRQDQVLDFWPVELADGARRWVVSNLERGIVSNANLELQIRPEDIENGSLPDDQLSLSFGFREGQARIISTLPPIRNGAGTAELRGNSFSLRMREGALKGLSLSNGRVDIPRLVPKGAMATFSTDARGPARDVLEFIDGEPLGYPSAFGIDPASISGAGTISVTVGRPMREVVPVERMTFDVTGRFDDVAGPVASTDLRLTDARVAISADENELRADINGMMGPTPAGIVWVERFRDREESPPSRYTIETDVTRDLLDAFGLPSRNFLAGRVPVVLEASGNGFDVSSARVSADLTAADITLPGTLDKPAGEQAEARFVLEPGPQPAGGFVFSDIYARSSEFLLSGRARIDASGRLLNAAIDRMQAGENFEGSLVVDPMGTGGLSIGLVAERADLRGILPAFLKGGGGPGVPLSVSARIDRGRFTDSVDLNDIRVDLVHSGTMLQSMELEALGPNGPLRAEVLPSEVGALGTAPEQAREFMLVTEDAELILGSALNMDQVSGGRLELFGQLLQEEGAQRIRGEARLTDFSVVGAPTLARMLTLGSLRGLADTLAGEGISFNTLQAPFEVDEKSVRLNDAKASGPALGVTVSGEFSLKSETVDVQGVLVPAYSVNSVLGEIPILGDLLVSRDGEGIIGLTYSVEGPFSATRVFVNPLSALAPGVLRRMFEEVPTGDDPPSQPPAATSQ